jgi:hypothetical protein
VRTGDAGLRRTSDVAVMQAANFGDRDDHTELRRFDRPSIRCIFVEREVRAGPVIVREVRREDSSKVTLAENDSPRPCA